MSDDKASGHAEIVIVRRRGGDDTPTKGGAWKIAYADFVTAMMAFFLVMWLINASNEATRAQVASYFNPIKLTDNSTGKKGLKEAKERTEQGKDSGGEAGGTAPAPSDVHRESELMANPDKVLAKLEEEAKAQVVAVAAAAPSSAGSDSTPADPFEPPQNSAAAQPPSVPEPTQAPMKKSEAASPEADTPPNFSAETLEPAPNEAKKPPVPQPKPDKTSEKSEAKSEDPVKAEQQSAKVETQQPTVKGAKAAADAEAAKENAEAQQIADEISKKLGTGLDKLPESVEVKRTNDGILISLTDKENFGMFRNGSAEPVPELVSLIGAIAGVLKDRDGYIVVRGHTDSKPYRIKTYDNWQLSTDRAHYAQYMLMRAGLDGARIRRIEGVADREPRNVDDPQAPENRRIEILLGRDKKA